MRKRLALVLCLVWYFIPLAAIDNHPPHVSAYINNYYELAIREMHRSGIPASITLAQGIHESSWGRGELSVNSNNHFGIKCKEYWSGQSFYIEDDDFENGVLIKSCFRVYNSVDDSYIDHTNFLVQNNRYKDLFEFTKTDYENWANGLQTAGYATDPLYAKKLITNIEKYGLHKYDYVEEVQAPVVMAAPNYQVPVSNIPDELNDDEEGDDEYEEYDEYETDEQVLVATAPTIQEVAPAKEYVMEASTVFDNEVPAAVSIENYQRNSNESRIVAPIIIEKKIKRQEKPVEQKKVKPAPSYTLTKKGYTPQKAVLDTRVSNDNNGKLFQLRAKPRLSSKLR